MPPVPGDNHDGAIARAYESLGDVELTSALDRLPVPLLALDSKGRVAWANEEAAALLGVKPGLHFSRFIAPERVNDERELFARKLLGQQDATVHTTVLVTRESGKVPADLATVPLYRAGKVAGILMLVRPVPPPARAPKGRRPLPRLTPRQHQVLELLARGESTPGIAGSLGIAEDTARNHIRSLLNELGVHTRLEAVAVAFRNDWL